MAEKDFYELQNKDEISPLNTFNGTETSIELRTVRDNSEKQNFLEKDQRRDKKSSISDDEESCVSVSSASGQGETWTRGLDFILSLLGYAVGLGNLWRFPYLCMRNGGGAFLIPFIFCLIACGLPMFFLEVSLGQFLGKSSLHAWIVCPLFQGVGIGMIIVSAIFGLYYNMITAWTLYYLANSFTATLPWTTCGNWWNSKHNCVVQLAPKPTDGMNATVSLLNATTNNNTTNITLNGVAHKIMSSEEEFWQYNVLQLSSGLGDFGQMPWHLPLCLFGAWTLVFFCIMKGVHSIGKVVYVTVLLPYVLLTVFFVKGLTLKGSTEGILYYLKPDLNRMMTAQVVYVTVLLPYVLLTVFFVKGLTLKGSTEGILYYLKPDLNRMMTAQVWVEAALQVFYSLGPGWGPLITMSSYNRFNNNCWRDSIVIVVIGEGTSIFCGMVVFTILGYIAYELNVPIKDVVNSGHDGSQVHGPNAVISMLDHALTFHGYGEKGAVMHCDNCGGPGLGFIAYPQALARLPVPQLWAVLFFVMLLLVGLDSQFASAENIVAALMEYVPRLRKRRTLLSIFVCFMGFLIGLPMCFQGGMYIFQLVDWYVAIFAIPLFGMVECIVLGWIYGAERYSRDLELMLGRSVPTYIRFCWCFVTPGTLFCCFIFTLWKYTPASYGDYNYPVGGQIIGWFIASLPLLPVPFVAIRKLQRQQGSLLQRLSVLLKPSHDWQPKSLEHQKTYHLHSYDYTGTTLLERIKINIRGDWK